MNTQFSESLYPLTFREKDAQTLGAHLKLRHSVELVGMKRVGISNFLHFFLYHEKIVKTYIDPNEKHMFVAIDLNDLVEKDIFAFWILTFKRVVDRVEESGDVNSFDKKKVSSLFLSSIQSRNLFLTLENLREVLKIIVSSGILPTIFFIRFDRISDVVSEEFLANLEGMLDATVSKLSFVFTSFRALDDLSPQVFSRKSLSVFSHLTYVRSAKEADMRTIFDTFEKKYDIKPSADALSKIIEICAGHVQYLQISLIVLSALLSKGKIISSFDILDILINDERVSLISEEIWDSLTDGEKAAVKKIIETGSDGEDQASFEYLSETGLVSGAAGKLKVFSPLFEFFVQRLIKKPGADTVDFTKKENALYQFLLSNMGQICEREDIIQKVWVEYEDVGVSDWTIDQLVARLRTKLKLQKSPYAIKTVRTRGYRLVEAS